MPAQKLWYAILEAQIETDGPFMTYKDHTNRKSNQKNLGTIKSSNLCTEIIEYSYPEETAVCNVASLALPSFVVNGEYDFKKLHDKELENVGMPWFEVDGKGSRTFVALIDVASYARNIGTMPFE